MDKSTNSAQASEQSSTANPTSKPNLVRWLLDKHNLSRTTSIIFCLILVIFVSLGVFLSRVSLTHVSLAGIRVKNAHQLVADLKQSTDQYKLTVAHPDNTTKSFNIKEASISIDFDKSISEAMKAKMPTNWLMRLNWRKHTDVPLVLNIDDNNLQNFIRDHATLVSTPATDASLKIEQGKVIVGESKPGTGNSISRDAITAAVAKLQNTPLVMNKQDLAPAITTERAASIKPKIENTLVQKITFTIGDNVIKPTAYDIGQWIELTPVPSASTIDITVNSGQVGNYLQQSARKYIQPPRSQVVVPQSMGGQVIIAGKNGVDMVNKDAAIKAVSTKLLDGKGLDVSLPVQYAPFTTITAQPEAKWIIIDVTTKRLYAYEQTNLVRTVLISAGAPATPTVTGQFKIYSKIRKQDMRGNNADGSRYFQPNVEWVNYFYTDYAIHGNYWRPTSYFGNVNSSHGCVGAINSEAAWLYNWAPVGTTVVVHR